MADSIIILDVVLDRASDQQTAQLCTGLSSVYYSTNASANQAYTFAWGPNGGLSGNVKISVGSATFLLEYNGSTQKVEAIGTCGGTNFGNFSVMGQNTLVYNSMGVGFTVVFHLIDGAAIEITIHPGNNTTIAASSPQGFA